ncbi:MAG: class II aldolase/adducin family protein [Bacteriovoracaceae bacterium]|nr:class II aldolase/adducin family protein [Bacteriovoracaceae bacterium]
MKIIDDGIIKYDKSSFIKTGPLPAEEYLNVEKWRKILNKLKLISVYPHLDIGYGNISQKRDYQKFNKSNKPQFVITGTQTGKYGTLSGEHYTRVIDYDIDYFQISTMGPLDASSEALTHAAIYELNQSIRAVIHIHHEGIWNGMIRDHSDATSKFIPYGTKEMALAVKDCISRVDNNIFTRNGFYDGKSQGIFVMKGHHEGVISYGPNLSTAGNLILKIYKKYVSKKVSFL